MVRSTRKLVQVARKALGRTSRSAPPAEPETPVAKKPAPSKRVTPAAKRATPAAKKPAPAKRVAPAAKKVAPAKRAAPAKKPAPAKTVAPAAKKVAPAKKAAPAKKPAPAKKASASNLVVREGEDAWTAAELAEVLEGLHSQRTHSQEIVEAKESELAGLLRDAGDGAGHDQADVGASSFERDHELTILANEQDKLAQIDRALSRIDDSTYGVCESCGNPIGKMRLMAFPRATLCMSCKQREERR